ncbi:MAG TPA: anti-sigma factor, partial [Lysobacter sp.]|nr:anti-sigma factor [Lysobacter sp.]
AASRDAFAARVARDPALARMMDAWRGRLAPMVDEFVPVVPPLHLWHGVRQRAGLDATEPTTTPLWERLAFWRGMGLAGLATTAACVVAFIALPRIAPAPLSPHSALPHPVRLVSTMADGKGRATFMAAVDDDACTIVLMPLDRTPTPGQVPELWVIASDGVPRALGVGDDAPLQAMKVPAALREGILRGGLQATASLAVSMEPAGGSPTGRPTGFIAGRGALTRL